MLLNTLFNIFLGSIPGTIVMTLFMYFYSAFFKKETRVIHIFGSMITGNTPLRNVSTRAKSVIAGTIGHFSVGFFFALIYYALLKEEVVTINFSDAFVAGLLSGITAILIWMAYLYFHFNPPRISRIHYFIALLLSHIFFGIVTFYSFLLLMPDKVKL